jgi:putative ABC transport system permease protein
MHSHPPRWAGALMRIFCSDQFIDELEGDLYELYERNLEAYGQRSANWRYVISVLLSFRLYRTRLPFNIKIHPMIKFNLLIAIRHGVKNLSFSLINLLGLSLGIAATLYISLFILSERHVDSFHENSSEMYRVLTRDKKASATPSLLGAMISQHFPEVKVCRIGNDPIKIGEEQPFLIEDFYWSDSTFFTMFSFPLLKGNPHTALSEPNSLVITNAIAQQLFPYEEALGKVIDVKIYDSNETITMKITGIAADPGANSSIQFKALGSMHNAEQMYANLVTSWGFNWLTTYVHAPDGTQHFATLDFPTTMAEKLKEKDLTMTADLQPFEEMYLHSQDLIRNRLEGSIEVLYIMGSIGLLILVISLLNYINLNTARVSTRLGELKIKQAMGSNHRSIIWQYLIEALLYILISAVVGLAIVAIFLAPLNAIFNVHFSLAVLSIVEWSYCILILCAIGLIAGLVSAAKLIKGIVTQKGMAITDYKETNAGGRKVLMGIQYIITLFLTSTAIMVYMQFDFMSNYSLGFDSEQLIYVTVEDRALQEKIATIKTEMQKVSGVVAVAASGERLPSAMNNTYDLSWPGLDENENHGIDVVGVDSDYFDVVGIELTEGLPFIHDYAVDSARTIILNEQAKILIGDADLVGKQITVGGRSRKVGAVVKNHHTSSLHSVIAPVAYFVCPPGNRVSPDNLYLRVNTENLGTLQERLEDVWATFSVDPIDLHFVNQEFASAYELEKRLMLLASSLTIIAIVIAFLGLFGLITFTVQQKMKELCVRKVLGASLANLSKILSRDFSIIFAVSVIVSSPIAFLFGQKWLSNYPYNIGFNPLILLSAILICLIVSALVIGARIVKLSRVNPSKILRDE